mgnify:CR=1 FL=1
MPKLTIDKNMIRELAELLAETGLNEIEWSEGGVQLRVARSTTLIAPLAAAPLPAPAHPAAVAETAPGHNDLGAHPGAVKSPMVGTVYVAAEPGNPPLVRVGDRVEPGQTLLIVEAMKTMNPIPAPRGGMITQILVENQMPVEYGQVMMLIE